MICFLKRFLSHTGGIALMEFALVFPVLMTLFLGGAELTRYTLTLMRLQKSAYVLTDVVSQFNAATSDRKAGEINGTRLREVLNQYELLMKGDASKRVMMITSIQRVGVGGTVIRWKQSGGGTLSGATSVVTTSPSACGSCLGVGMTPVALQADYNISGMRANENMLIGEVFYYYEPLLNPLLSNFGIDFQARILSRVMFMAPRGGTPLVCLPEGFIYAGEC